MDKKRRILRKRNPRNRELLKLLESMPTLIAITYCEDELGMEGDDIGIDSEYYSFLQESSTFSMEFILYCGRVFKDYLVDIGFFDYLEIPYGANHIEFISDQIRRM